MLIYFILNIVNDKIYIGQTRFENLNRRYSGGFHKHPPNQHLRNAYAFYGPSAFIIGPLRYCDSLEDLDRWEKYFIEHFNSTDNERGYNKEHGGNDQKVVSFEARRKNSLAQKKLCQNQDWKAALKERSVKYWTEEDNRKNKSAHMKEITRRPDSRLANSIRQGGKPFRVAKGGIEIGVWINKKECARDLKLDRRKIIPCLNGLRKSHRGYTFQWL